MVTPPWLSEQCNKTIAKPYPTDGKLYCNATFDTVRCWGVTLAGTRTYGDCPKSLPQSAMFSSDGYSFKDCTKNGTWWTHPLTGRPWTNYTTCIQGKLEKANTLLYVYISGFAVSLVLLLISMVIFSIFRQLRCTRVSMHRHLFTSYIINAVLWIPYYFILMDVRIVDSNPIWCRILHVTTQYATICNYAWMFCEGLYLHSVIAFAFTNQKRLLIICCIIGWVVPLLPTAIYAIVHAAVSTNEKLSSCWKNASQTMWIPLTPIILSLVLNFIFLINILRILLSKLRAVNTNETHQYRRTARACLILIPLLGVQYIMMPFQPSGDAFAYKIISAILISYQGAFVSLLFCFFNGEVIQCFKRYFQNTCGWNCTKRQSGLSTHVSALDRTQYSVTEGSSKSNGYCALPLEDMDKRLEKSESKNIE